MTGKIITFRFYGEVAAGLVVAQESNTVWVKMVGGMTTISPRDILYVSKF